MNSKIHFSEYTEKFSSGLPIGNGQIAAMVLGSPQKNRFALNHEELWSTRARKADIPMRADRLKDIRRHLDNEDHENATLAAHDAYSRYFENSNRKIAPYVPAGDLFISIDTGEIYSYSRSLDIKSGEVKVSFKSQNYGNVEMSAFISSKLPLGLIEIKSEKPCEPSIELSRTEDENCVYTIESTALRTELHGVLDGELFFLMAVNHRKISENHTLISFGIDVSEEKSKLFVPSQLPEYAPALSEHKSVFEKKLGESEIILDTAEITDTTDKRVSALSEENDISLPIMFFNFAKYLMASGSGKFPNNLQGKWNEEILPPWSCDYHLDINLQMNYWFTDVLGMGYANEALFNYCERCIPNGRKRAKNLYNCRGICFDHASDLYGSMFHDAYGWGTWISAAPWLAQHFYRHYLYTADIDFLRERAYPFICECLDFYEDYTFIKNGKLCIAPSCSPENRFIGAGELFISICENSAADVSLYRELIIYAIDCAKALGLDDSRWQRLLSLTHDLKIGSDGRLLEWDKEYEEAEPQHRHLSHLVGFYPGWLIEKGSDLAVACEKSLDYRLSVGGGHTGWSRSWVACLYARLGRGEDFWESIKNLICEQCSPSLLDFHPFKGGPVFQIDGNFGGAAAIAEAFVSTRYNETTLLGACPTAWKSGKIKHFKLPYLTDISFDFSDGKVTKIELTSAVPHEIKLIYPNGSMTVSLEKDKKYEFAIN